MQKRSEERGECRVARQFACMCFSFVPMHKERRRVQRTRVDHRGKGRIIEGKRERETEARGRKIYAACSWMLVCSVPVVGQR